MEEFGKHQKIVLLGSWLGWSLDGYDLVLMLFVIPSISQLFFPSENPTISLVATFSAYIVALLVRPLGGAFFGNFADKKGRKKTMTITIWGFALATFSMGLLPTWDVVGVFAPVLLILLRFTQGFFAGGEWGSGAVITMESTIKKKRGMYSGFLQSGFSAGFLSAAIAFHFISNMFPGESFVEIGWRILFFTGIIPGFAAVLVRTKMHESYIWLHTKHASKLIRAPFKEIFSKKERKPLFLSLLLLTGLMYAYYATVGFFPTFFEDYQNLERSDVSIIMIGSTLAILVGIIFTGYISQLLGRRKTLTVFSLAAIFLSIPLVWGLFDAKSIFDKTLYSMAIVFVSTTGFGVIPAFLSERFPTRIRTGASGLVFNGGLIIGSWAPIIGINLVVYKDFAPYLFAVNIIIGSIIVFVGARLNPETRDNDLDVEL